MYLRLFSKHQYSKLITQLANELGMPTTTIKMMGA
jgi:hypothetical protein